MGIVVASAAPESRVEEAGGHEPLSTQDIQTRDQSGRTTDEPQQGPTTTVKQKKKKKRRFLLAPSNLLSGWLFLWIVRLVGRIRATQDPRALHLCLSPSESCSVSGDSLAQAWEKEGRTRGAKASLLSALWTAFGWQYLALALWKFFWIFFTWVGAFWVLKSLIALQDSENPSLLFGHFYAALLFLTSFLGSLCFHQLGLQSTRIGIQCRGALMVLIYRKSLCLSYLKGGAGEVVNLISNDCNRIAEACVNGHYLWAALLECLVVVVLSLLNIGFIPALPSNILILFVVLPLQYYLARKASAISYETTSLITKRVHLMSEVLTAIKLIKFYAWEDYYLQKINAARKTEVDKERSELVSKIAGFMMIFVAPVLCMLLCLVMLHFVQGSFPNADLAFSLLALFNTLRYPLLLLPSAERTITGAQISISRLQEYCKQPEIDPPSEPLSPPESNPDLVLEMVNAEFKWDGDLEHPHITDLSVQLKRGQVIAVVGDVGSGKSFLAAVMRQIKQTAGTVHRYGTFGYVPQEPWLIDATIRDNIMFGLDIDEAKYLDTIRLVGLTRDLMLLSNGDEMFVNELNLSPSQRQRVSLARCICHEPDLVLIEDCFGDFDQAQAKRLFKECIKTELRKNKCVVMLTQHRKFLSECDQILVMKSGKVVERGTYSELKARHVNFSAWVSDLNPIEDDPTGVLDRVNEIKLDSVAGSNYVPFTKYVNPLNPQSSTESLSPLQFRQRLKKPSPLATASVINAPQEESIVDTKANTNNTSPTDKSVDPDQATIRQIRDLNAASTQNSRIDEAVISKLIERNQSQVLTGSASRPPPNFSNQDVVSRTIEANQLTVHSLPVHGISSITETATFTVGVKKPTTWEAYLIYIREASLPIIAWTGLITFLILPAVRLVNDVWLMFLVEDLYSYKLSIGIYGGFSVLIAIGVFARGYGFSYAVLVRNISLHNRVLKAVLRAPMSFYDATPLGNILSFFARHLFLIDEFLPEAALQVMTFGPIILGAVVLVSSIVPWFALTLPAYLVLGYLVIQASSECQDKLQQYEASNKSPLFAHLSITLEGLFSIRLYNVQDRFSSYFRTLIDSDHKALYSLLLVKSFMAFYLDIIACIFIYIAALFVVLFRLSGPPTGLALTNAIQLLLFVQWLVRMIGELHSSMGSVSSVIFFSKSIPREFRDKDEKAGIPDSWPDKGTIEFQNVTVRYHQYGVAVLKSVSFAIESGEKIAIVGRSGSGKTTLLMSLLRMTEPAEGNILIDGIITGTVGLRILRSKLAVIPQQPVMFSGTIRSNLDPFGLYTDDQIWDSLRAVHLNEKIKEMPGQLETPVTENGKTFSQAERQLFSIARAVLVKSKIVVFDEPAISVDNETDDLIREVIKENFMDRTVIILANRFRLIVQMDRILVMDHGRVVEFDTPLNLLENPKSKFSLMVSQTGDVDPLRLKQLAMTKSEKQRSQSPSGVAMERGISRDSNTQNTTRSIDSQNSLPRSLKDIFISPETNKRSSKASLNSQSSASSEVVPEIVELKVLPVTGDSATSTSHNNGSLHPGIPSPSSNRPSSLLKQHLKKQLE